MKFIQLFLATLSISTSAIAANSITQKELTTFYDWDDEKDDDKGPSKPKHPVSKIDFANKEQIYACRIGGQPCNYLASCCDGFSCQSTLSSLRTRYCVATTNKDTNDVGDRMEESFVDSCRPYTYSCSSNADCCDGLTCLDVGAGLLYCLNLFDTAET